MKRPRLQLLLAAVILLTVFIVNVVVTHDGLTKPHPGHNDLLTVWEAGRSFWRDGLDPYGETTTLNIQSRIYGRAAEQDEFPNSFAYPMYSLVLMLPLVFTDFSWAAAIYMVVSEACFILALVLLLDLFRWKPPRWMVVILALWSLLHYFAVRGLVLGQLSNVVYLMQVVVLWALARDRQILAGAALALSTIKPQMGFLLIPFLVLWGLRTRRAKFVAATAGTWIGLMLISFALQPDWMLGWIGQLRVYPNYTVIGAPTNIVMQAWLGLGAVGEWVANFALWGVLLWAWYSVLVARRMERLDWTVMLTLAITHLTALRTATPHFVVFAIPLVFYLREISRRPKRTAWVVLILLTTLVLFWVQFLLTVDQSFEHPSMYVIVPFGMLVVLVISRRDWWVAHTAFNPDRTASVG